jgi:hypothetical protein
MPTKLATAGLLLVSVAISLLVCQLLPDFAGSGRVAEVVRREQKVYGQHAWRLERQALLDRVDALVNGRRSAR